MQARPCHPCALVACVALLCGALVSGGCARPYHRQKTLAAIGTSVLVGGAGMWAVADRKGSNNVAVAGVVTAVLGAAAVVAAGGWLASAIGCTADPDCPDTEECREVPAPPGREPYKQCMPRL